MQQLFANTLGFLTKCRPSSALVSNDERSREDIDQLAEAATNKVYDRMCARAGQPLPALYAVLYSQINLALTIHRDIDRFCFHTDINTAKGFLLLPEESSFRQYLPCALMLYIDPSAGTVQVGCCDNQFLRTVFRLES